MGRSRAEGSRRGEILISLPELCASDKTRLLKQGNFIYLYSLSYKEWTVNLLLLFHLPSEKFNINMLMSTQIPKACAVPNLHKSEEPGSFGSTMESLTGSHVPVFVPILPNELGTCRVKCD